ncbi:hypothetical protein BEP19_10785 [Ammoniphilus oxalaticus]|uniref:Integrase n=1 Tax=Ammoniphilus oxalaticus TaxID=66863 RepID=A0A419SG25_9BACL|nr:tyrosine-type recombinase/integrase [Ammoniphilus oxalaticus]RKD22729.1 hypothetical protein BEP19_10785 [Ammoniphilus oxalaticus]
MQPLWPEHEAWLADYKMYLSHKREPSTVKMYLAEVKHFLDWLEVRNKHLSHLSQADVISFRDEMVGRGMKTATINKWVSIITSFHRWAIENEILTEQMAKRLRLDEDRRDRPRWLSQEEERHLLEVASVERNPFRKSRNEALIHIMMYAGLRIEEVSLLEFNSMDYGDLVIYEDGEERRRVPIQSNLQLKLLEWMKHRSQSSKLFHQNSPFLFVTERSGHMQPRSIQFVVEGFSAKTEFPITCQMLRHTFCRRLVEQNAPIEQIKEWAGHKTIQSTIQYFDH